MSAYLDGDTWRYQCRAAYADGTKTKIHGTSHHACNTQAGADLAEAEHKLWVRSQPAPRKGARLRFQPSEPGTGDITHVDVKTLVEAIAPTFLPAVPVPCALTVRHWLNKYLDGLEGTIALSSLDDKRDTFEDHIFETVLDDGRVFGDLPLSALDTDAINQLRNVLRQKQNPKIKRWEQPLSHSTVNKVLKYTKTALRCAKFDHGLEFTVPKFILLQTDDPDWDILEPEELVTVLNAAEGMWRVMISLAAGSGLRRSELRALSRWDLNLKVGNVHVQHALVDGEVKLPKSGKKRFVDLPPAVVAEVSAWLATHSHDLVFCMPDGSPLPTGLMASQLDRITRSVGMRRIGWHVFRHTYASHLIEANVDVETVRLYMGHSDIRITQMYVHKSRRRSNESMLRLEAHRDEARKRLMETPAAPAAKISWKDHREGRRVNDVRPESETVSASEGSYN